jgi:hypothetical protein
MGGVMQGMRRFSTKSQTPVLSLLSNGVVTDRHR